MRAHRHAGVDRQTVQNAIEAYTYFFEHLVVRERWSARISDFGYADGALNITANIAASPLYISLTPSRITLRTQVDAANLTVTAAPGQRLTPPRRISRRRAAATATSTIFLPCSRAGKPGQYNPEI